MESLKLLYMNETRKLSWETSGLSYSKNAIERFIQCVLINWTIFQQSEVVTYKSLMIFRYGIYNSSKLSCLSIDYALTK